MTDKITLSQVGSLQDTTTAAATLNKNFAIIQSAFDNTLSLDGTAPNQMGSNLDMNSNQILNLPVPASVNSPARLIDVTSNPTISVPPVGTSGAVVGLLNANKTDSGNDTFTGNVTFTGTVTFPGSGGGGGVGSTSLPQGRLTLTSQTPVMRSNVVATSQLYYDNYSGNQAIIYNGTGDIVYTIASGEISDTLPTTGTGVTNNNGVFDLFLINVSGVMTLVHVTNGSGGGWASDSGSNTARGTGYSVIDFTTRAYPTNKNILTNAYNGSTNYGPIPANRATYVGSFYTTSAGQTGMNFKPGATSGGNNSILGLYNAYNQVKVYVSSFDNRAGGWTTTSGTWEPTNVSGTGLGQNNRVSWLDGLGQSLVEAECTVIAQVTTGSPEVYAGIVFDAISGQPAGLVGAMSGTSGSVNVPIAASDELTAVGLHFAQAMQNSSNATFFGIVNGNQLQRTRACLSM